MKTGGICHQSIIPIPDRESAINRKINKAIDGFITGLEKQFSMTRNVKVERRLQSFPGEPFIVNVADSLDETVEAGLQFLMTKKWTHFWQRPYQPKIEFRKFKLDEPKSYLSQIYERIGAGGEL